MKQHWNKALAALGGAALAIGIITAALAAGMFQYPAVTLPFTGSETVPMDTNLSSGRYPQTETATMNQVSSFTRTPVVLTDAATITWDASQGSNYMVTLGGNRTVATPTNVLPGQVLRLEVAQDGTGSRTLTWNGFAHWAGEAQTAPTLTTTPSRIDVIYFLCDQVTTANLAVRCLGTPAPSINFRP